MAAVIHPTLSAACGVGGGLAASALIGGPITLGLAAFYAGTGALAAYGAAKTIKFRQPNTILITGVALGILTTLAIAIAASTLLSVKLSFTAALIFASTSFSIAIVGFGTLCILAHSFGTI